MSNVDLEISRVAQRQYGVVSQARLRSIGLSESQVRRRVADGRLHRVHRGVYATGHSTLTTRGFWLGAVFAVGAGALLSYRDAAALWDLRTGRGPRIEVTVAGGSRRQRRGLLVHRARDLPPDDRALRGRIVTALPRTLLDLSEVVSPDELQRAFERAAMLRLLDLNAIRSLLERSNGRRGVPRLAALLDYDPGPAAEAKSELERIFLRIVREAALPIPEVNVLVEGYLVDAYWPAARLVVELDSYQYHHGRQVFERDHAMLGELRLAGYEVLPLTWRQVTDRRQWVVTAIEHHLGRVEPLGSSDRCPSST